MGQTFTTGSTGYFLDKITLRTGNSDNAVRTGALGAGLVVQIFEVNGIGVINDNGTVQAQKVRSFNNDGRSDDFITGETYTSLGVIRGGTLPTNLGKNDYFTLDFTGQDEVYLSPNKQYAFLLGFEEAGDARALGLANQYFGSYGGGHGIRWEGSIDPAEPGGETTENPDTAWTTREAATFDAGRFAKPPTTNGRPDVDTYRDLLFFVEGYESNSRDLFLL